MRRHRPSGRQSGVALIEALIGFLLFAVGVLGLVGLQVSMTRAQTGAKARADATMLAHEVLGAMWADSQANHPKYDGQNCKSHLPCQAWQDKVQRSLPKGVGTVAYSAANNMQVTVTVRWTLPEEGEHKVDLIGSVAP